VGLILLSSCEPHPEPAALVFVDGAIYTGDPLLPWAEALAVRGEHIVHVGSRADATRFTGDATRLVELDGRLLLPRLDDEALVAIHEAVTGRDLSGRTVTNAPVTVEDAIAVHVPGSLVAGAPADLTVLQENILEIPAERIAEAKIEMSVVGGRVVYVARTFDRDFEAPRE
jgi:predicted amidohydrolase YtcJ